MKKLVINLCASIVMAACSPEQSSRLDDSPGASTACQPSSPRQCPCQVGVAMGTQLCNETGDGYGPCTGCPEPPDNSGQSSDASMNDDASNTPGSSMKDAAPGSGYAQLPDASGDGNSPVDTGTPVVDTGTPVVDTGTPQVDTGTQELEFGDINIMAPGISCGVGLPRLCELGVEMCCVRSMDTDTCIPLNSTCDCQYAGCQVMQAYCDGPEDCADNEVCCGTISTANFSDVRYTLIECTSQCNSGFMGTQYEVCHQGETECGPGLICANSQLLTNIQVCVDPASLEQ